MMSKEAATPLSKHADRLIPPNSSQKYSWVYLWVHRSWEADRLCFLKQLLGEYDLLSL